MGYRLGAESFRKCKKKFLFPWSARDCPGVHDSLGKGEGKWADTVRFLFLSPLEIPQMSNYLIISVDNQSGKMSYSHTDALRSVHNLNNFEFDNKKTALLSPGYVVPAIIGGTELASPFATTPTSNRELQAILQAMVGTPLGQPSTATHSTGFPNAFSSIIPGPSTAVSTAAPSTSVSNGSSEGTLSGLKMDIKQELSDDSNDTMSDTMSRSSSVMNSSSHGMGMGLDDQERRKLERKRARNRAAASKCRQKKMDRIQDLETQVQSEKVRSQVLDSELMRLRTALTQLEHVMQRHRNQGCANMAQQQQQQC